MSLRLVYVLLSLCLCGPACAETLKLRENDMIRIGNLGWTVPLLKNSQPETTVPIIAPGVSDTAAGMLRRLNARGMAAGLEGVLYDNRDRGHSLLPNDLFPQMTSLEYDAKLIENGIDYGLAGDILFPVPTLGNSSTAVTDGIAPRSLVRLAMTTQLSPARQFRGYATNHLYIYPEHEDHDDVDLYPANWPYAVVSQGSSGSDQPFLRALAMTLSAFSPETRKRLEAEKLIAPTLQMILRRTQKGAYGPDAYKSGLAHPTVFDASRLSPERMVSLAASIGPNEIPPMIRLKVVSDDFRSHADFAGLTEKLYTTPSAISRIWRGFEYKKQITLSAEGTKDPNGRDLQFFWILLRGDSEKVHIQPTEDGYQATVEIAWHDPFPITQRHPRLTSRVDVGVIAWNGTQFSAPAFLSVNFPRHQVRIYESAEDGQVRLLSLDYDAQARMAYYDPLLHWSAPWKDRFHYDKKGQLEGWQRDFVEGRSMSFTATGVPNSGAAIEYQMIKSPAGQPVLDMQTALDTKSQ